MCVFAQLMLVKPTALVWLVCVCECVCVCVFVCARPVRASNCANTHRSHTHAGQDVLLDARRGFGHVVAGIRLPQGLDIDVL